VTERGTERREREITLFLKEKKYLIEKETNFKEREREDGKNRGMGGWCLGRKLISGRIEKIIEKRIERIEKIIITPLNEII
jgi:hypothetical protein